MGEEGKGKKRASLLPPGDRRLLAFETEWATVMARMKREGNTLSATLRAAWEGGNLSTLGVNARIVRDTHVGILAHITPKEFQAKLSASDMAGGTYNRFLPVLVAQTQFLPNSTGADPALLDRLAVDLRARPAAGLMAATGVYLGDGPHMRAGDDRHPLLVWPMVIGRTGVGRKGAGWSAAKRLLLATDPDFEDRNIHSGLTSRPAARADQPGRRSRPGDRADQPGRRSRPGDRAGDLHESTPTRPESALPSRGRLGLVKALFADPRTAQTPPANFPSDIGAESP